MELLCSVYKPDEEIDAEGVVSPGHPAEPCPSGLAEGRKEGGRQERWKKEDSLEAFAGNLSEKQSCSNLGTIIRSTYRLERMLLVVGAACEGWSC